MELFSPEESITYAALEFERTVLEVEQAAINCEVSAIALQVAQQEVVLASIHYRQAQIELAIKERSHAQPQTQPQH